MPGIGPLKGAYHVARRCGFLDTGFGRGLFLRSYFAYKRYLEDSYAALIRRHPDLFRGGHVIDVGANVGYCSTLFARACDPECLVYAIEPEAFNFELLESVVRAHGLSGKVIPVRAAAGASSGVVDLWVNPSHHGDHRVSSRNFRPPDGSFTQVRMVSIDSLAAENRISPVRFIKADVQGYELEVCRGMEQTLAANPECVVSVEYMPSAMRELGFTPRDLMEWFASRGFAAHTLLADGTLQPGVCEPEKSEGYVDLVFRKDTVPGV